MVVAGDITQRLLEERIAELESMVVSCQAQIIALVWELGKGKRVAISRGSQRQADQNIGELEVQRMSSTGDLRFTPHRPVEVKSG